MRMYFGLECCDAGISTPRPEYPPEWTKPHISMYDHLNYKFILAIEGYDVATNLKWIMSSNSLAVMPRPTYETWFMEGTLIPGYHYVEIRPDYSDLEERMRYYIEHPDEAEAIIAHAHEYVAQSRHRPPKPVFQTGEITARIRKETEMPGISAARCAGNNSARPAVK
jgi:hypothetical protein